MATDTIEAERPVGATATPPRSVVDRLLAVVDRFPGPAAVWYFVLALALVALAHAWIWAMGARRVGEFEPEVFPPAVILAYFLWLLHLLNRIASSSFDAFRPALGGSALEEEHYRRALTSIPDRVAVVAVLVVEVVLNVGYYGTVRPLRPPLPPAVEIASAIIYMLDAAAIGLLVVHDIRQLRLVSRLSALATNVDIFKPGPVTALSRLTAITAIGIIAFVAAFGLSGADSSFTSSTATIPMTFVAELAIMTTLALASFVLPLRVMHGRLLEQKLNLLDSAQDRLKVLLGRISDAVDTDDLSNADELNKTLSSVLAQRDVLAKLPTWPWSSGTFRGVATAVLLPVVIFVITRLIDQLI